MARRWLALLLYPSRRDLTQTVHVLVRRIIRLNFTVWK